MLALGGTSKATDLTSCAVLRPPPRVELSVATHEHSWFHGNWKYVSERCLVDLSAVEWIELPATLLITSLIVQRVPPSASVKLTLPRDARPARFLVEWGYIQSFAEAVGHKPIDLLDSEDYERFLELNAAFESGRELVPTPNGTDEPLLPKWYYQIRTYGPELLTTKLVASLRQEWQSRNITAILRRIMGSERGKWVADNIIAELLTNGILHPGANLLQHGAQHERYGYRLPLKVCVWDNGQSIVDTLREPLLSEGEVVNRFEDVADVTVRVRVSDERDGSAVVIDQPFASREYRINAQSADWQILLGALFPGVSRDARLGRPGLGLHLIASAVTSRYSGEFKIRTGNLYLGVRPTSDSASYQADVRILPDLAGRIRGNLLSVTLPSKVEQPPA